MKNKADGRRRSPAQKARTRLRRQAKADQRRRRQEWSRSVDATVVAGCPINAFITILSDAEHIEEVTSAIWRRLRRLMQRKDLPFYAVRAPEYARNRGQHLHIALHLPPTLYGDVATALVEVIGSPMAGWFDVAGRSLGNTLGVVTKSDCGDWMLQRHVEGAGGCPKRLMTYAGKGDGKHRSIGRHQRSGELVRLTREHESATAASSEQRQPPTPPFSANIPSEATQSAV